MSYFVAVVKCLKEKGFFLVYSLEYILLVVGKAEPQEIVVNVDVGSCTASLTSQWMHIGWILGLISLSPFPSFTVSKFGANYAHQ